MHVTAWDYCSEETAELRSNLKQIRKTNLRAKKCSGQSRYSHYSSYATGINGVTICVKVQVLYLLDITPIRFSYKYGGGL